MGVFILVISAVLFISAFGIHMIISKSDEYDKPPYADNIVLSSLPWISGFIIPVFIWSQITEIHWVALFFINAAVVYVLGPWLTRGYIVRLASGKGFGKDMLTAFLAGIVTLVIGFLIK